MQPFPNHHTAATPDTIDPTVTISMSDDQLVICAPTDLDLEMTELLVIAAASAVATGSTAMIDLDPDMASDELIARRPLSAVTATCITRHGGQRRRCRCRLCPARDPKRLLDHRRDPRSALPLRQSDRSAFRRTRRLDPHPSPLGDADERHGAHQRRDVPVDARRVDHPSSTPASCGRLTSRAIERSPGRRATGLNRGSSIGRASAGSAMS